MTSAGLWHRAVDFEARYRADPDPWGYETSSYEQDKYRATLAACGPGPFGCAIELGGSIGVFSELLAPACSRLLTLDGSPTAVAIARERLADHANAYAAVSRIPEELPAERFDLIVASEILYYLTREELDATIAWMGGTLEPGGRVVCVHWRTDGPERPLTAEKAHQLVSSSPVMTAIYSAPTDDYLLDVLQRND